MQRLIALAVILAVPAAAAADDWPQWMGPKRDNVWYEKGLLEKFPAGGPKVVWRTKVAIGYAGPAVADGTVFVHSYQTKDDVKVANFQMKKSTGVERVVALDAKTGKPKWEHKYPVEYRISYPSGPRCTPTYDGGKVYTLGAVGDLKCFEAATGKVVWEKNLPEEFKTRPVIWGYAAHPLIDGDRLITLAGGAGSHIAAFNKNTGEVIWKALDSNARGYAPAKIIDAQGKRQLIAFYPEGVTSIDPATGKQNWSVEYRATSGSTIMTPVAFGEYVYVAGYSNKDMLIRLGEDGSSAKVVWKNLRDQEGNQEAISPVNVQPFAVKDVVYGFDHDGALYAMKLPSGKRLWGTPAPVGPKKLGTGTAFIVKQGDKENRFWLFNENGELVIADLTPEGYKEVDRAKILAATNKAFGRDVVWCQPAFAGKRMYVRNDEECVCVDLSAR